MRHSDAPLLKERAQYVLFLLQRGLRKAYIRSTANYMIRVIEVMSLHDMRSVSLDEIEAAAETWSDLGRYRRLKKVPPNARRSFIRVATGWLSFLGKLREPPREWFESFVQAFIGDLSTRSLLPKTVEGYAWQIRCFFRFLPKHYEIDRITAFEIDAFITAKIRDGWQSAPLASICQRLRNFFRFAEGKGWCTTGLHLAVRRIRRVTRHQSPKAPEWKEVIRLLKSFKGKSAFESRAKAMIMLCAIYGLRTVEVIRLDLGDVDWRNATFTIRRAKRGGVQQYPLLYEVGEAILTYLREHRPITKSRRVFVSHRAPYRETSQTQLWAAIGPRLREIGNRTEYVGAHSLRHACATRLLHKGASLKQIADFLGHRNVRSSDVYARLDIRRLRRVASFGISDLL